MADISKITLPSGNTYDIKDAVARQMISGGVSFIVGWDGASTPDPTKIPAGVVVKYNGTDYTGTLSAEDAQPGAFYLVRSSTDAGAEDAYDEYVPVGTTGTKTWEKIGDTQIDLTDVVTGVTLNKQTDTVLGTGTTFTNASSSVTFSGGTTDVALGEATTFTATDPTITVTPSTTYVKASASGTAVGADGTAAAVTGYPDVTTDTFVKSVSAETGKNLVTTTVPNVTGNTSVSIPNVTANTDVSVPNITGNSSVTANKSTWTFTMGSGDASETLIIGGGNGSDVSATNTVLGTANTASKVTLGSNLTATNTTLGTAITVATGGTSTTGTGDAVVTGVTVGSSASAITGLGTPSTATALTGVKVTSQPTVTLDTDSTSGTGKVQVATGISSATASGTGITVGANDKITTVTSIGTGTAAAQTITVGTNDQVTALTDSTSITVTKGNA